MGRLKKKVVKNTINWISFIAFYLLVVSSFILICGVIKINLVPMKYIVIASIVLLVLNALLYMMCLNKKKIFNIIQSILSYPLSFIFIIAFIFVVDSDNSLRDIFKVEDTESVYYILVDKQSAYESVEDIKNKEVGVLNQSVDKIEKELLEYNLTYRKYEVVGQVVDSLFSVIESELLEAIIISSGVYDYLESNNPEFLEKTKKIHEFVINIPAEESQDEEIADIDINNSFVVYISGIDGGGLPAYGLSDVNILAVVNPDTHKVLLINTPRDYYVQVAGTTGMKDKLTHAGLYGINTSIGTLNQLYDIKVSSYVKIGYDTLTILVDKLDGIDIYSDKTFNSFHIKGWVVKKGMNHFTGKQALAYSRERYAYSDGDRHRGENQQAVITAIIEKVATNKHYLLKFNEILDAVSPYIITNTDVNDVQELVKKQLNSLQPWTVESIGVNGTDSMNYTNSFPKQYTYVMIPNQDTIEEAKDKIKEVMAE